MNQHFRAARQARLVLSSLSASAPVTWWNVAIAATCRGHSIVPQYSQVSIGFQLTWRAGVHVNSLVDFALACMFPCQERFVQSECQPRSIAVMK
jgi:hypothetical protein